MSEPRYRQIVVELQHRIDAGELRPGDRVPSTREIVGHWGVAMATASKVLAELQALGVARAVPGVGTVVAEPEPSGEPQPQARRGPVDGALTPERIVTAAMAVADAEGLAALSMRRIGTEIGMAPMSLYRHIADKDDLLARMMDTAFAELDIPQRPSGSWRAQVEQAARMVWALFRGHPWLAPAMSMTRPQPLASAIPLSEWMLTALAETGLDHQQTFTAYLVVFNYLRGIAITAESERDAEAQTGMDNEEWMAGQEDTMTALIASGRYPRFTQLVSSGYDFDLDVLFESGLQRLLDGLAVQAGRGGGGVSDGG